ncbi:helix-turn-helix domain-containing protein [Paenibacillus sp. GCM10027626]|uniref:helix-turn-helix domain-containing protein n=1 Tax=Paenibacillus sp. GCM10027626 TaxID=3273411 RepID=UPI00362B1B5B
MNLLSDLIKFDGQAIVWSYRNRNETNFGGYYHWHQCCEMLLVHEGQGSVIVDQQTFQIGRGMLFFFQPFQLHKVYAQISKEAPYERTIIYLDPAVIAHFLQPYPQRAQFFERLWKGAVRGLAFQLGGAIAQAEWQIALYEQALHKNNGETEEEAALLLLSLLSILMGARLEGIPAGKRSAVITARPTRYSETIMQWIERHYAEEFHLERLAKETHLSKYYVSRIFREETGSNITDYLTARRIKQACRLLQTTTQSVERIGIEVGLPNVSYFIQLFKKVVGCTPLKYRQGS